jgi:predicted glycoside hydrolase/deacetylase ChbG (UPF0249 family)
MRRLVVNADDFGLSDAINRGVVRAHAEGIVTRASLMVRGAAARAAVAAARPHPRLAIGLHLDLGEWRYRDGEWILTDAVVDTDDRFAVADEVARQLRAFRAIVGRDPTHVDSHQHVHRDEPVRSVARDLAIALDIPLRHEGPARYCGAFYGQGPPGTPLPDAITAEALARIIRELPEGVTELCCHPSEEPEPGSDYSAERPLELAALCDPAVRAAVEESGVVLAPG